MRKWVIICTMFSLLLGCAGSGWARLISSDYSDSESGFANWMVGHGTADLFRYKGLGGPHWDLQPGKGLYLDTGGSTGDAGKTTSLVLELRPGKYVLSCDYLGNPKGAGWDGILGQVGGGSLLNGHVSAFKNVACTPVGPTFGVPSATLASISLEGFGDDNVGLLLDNVAVSMIPTPGGILLVGVGAGLVGWLRRRGTL